VFVASVAVVAAASIGGGAASATSGDPVASPDARPTRAAELRGPIDGGAHGFPFTASSLDLDRGGYREEEYFASGTAQSFEQDGEWGIDGRWAVTRQDTAPYATRILVRRPDNPDEFNGTVVVEWLNVSSGVDIDVDFGYLGEELVREGYAWVGVSAQEAGVESSGGGSTGLSLGPSAVGLRNWDPDRYRDLDHPGDQYSYDIFSQVGRALRRKSGPLKGLKVEHLIADGESQSAFRMLTYVNAIHPTARAYDGFLIHSRNGGGAPLVSGFTGVQTARVRTDLRVPVFQVQTETDMFQLGAPFPAARQSDSSRVRTWEIAGTAHADARYLRLLYEQGTRQFDDMIDLTAVFDVANNGPQELVMRAAIRALNDWVVDGEPPARAQPLRTEDGAIVRDEHGNALGGVRTPQLDVPVATLSGEDGGLIGKTTPFDAATLESLYPTHDDYVRSFARAADRATGKGFLLAEDARQLKEEAAESPVPAEDR
jgi:hypothetical protein